MNRKFKFGQLTLENADAVFARLTELFFNEQGEPRQIVAGFHIDGWEKIEIHGADIVTDLKIDRSKMEHGREMVMITFSHAHYYNMLTSTIEEQEYPNNWHLYLSFDGDQLHTHQWNGSKEMVRMTYKAID